MSNKFYNCIHDNDNNNCSCKNRTTGRSSGNSSTNSNGRTKFYHNGIKTGNNNVHFIGGKIRQQWIISMIIKLCWWLELREWQDYFPLQPNFITSWSKLFVTKCSSFQISNSGKVLLQVTPSFHDNRVVQLTYSNGITSITTWVRE